MSRDFRFWLRDELATDARRDAVSAGPSRRILLSDVEALALVMLCIEWQAEPGADSCTTDMAQLLASALLARLE